MASTTAIDLGQVSQSLGLATPRVQTVVDLLDAGNTVPFITRYRKDQTGGLDEEQIRDIQSRVTKLRLLFERKQTILRSIDSQGKLTPDLAAAIEGAHTTKRLEDLYLPYKPKKQTLATAARERGLEPLALEILEAAPACADLDARARDFISTDRKVATAADALLGAGHILAELFSERADFRGRLRGILQRTGTLVSNLIDADAKPSGERQGTAGSVAAATGSSDGSTLADATRSLTIDVAAEGGDLPPDEFPPDNPSAAAPPNDLPSAGDSAAETPPSADALIEQTPHGEPSPAPESASPLAENAAPDAAVVLTTAYDSAMPLVSAVAAASWDTAIPQGEGGTAAYAAASLPAAPLPPAPPAPASKSSRKKKKKEARKEEAKDAHKAFRDYFQYREAIGKVPPHRILAINRGERAKALRVRLEVDLPAMQQVIEELLLPAGHPHTEFLRGCGRDALDRLVLPSLEREARRELTDRAELHAVEVFARNLRNLLLQPPVRDRRVLAIDPGYKSGCKLVALDEFGHVLEHGVAHIVGSPQRRAEGARKAVEMVRRHQLRVIAIGNGTACRAVEQWVSDLLAGKMPVADAKPAPAGSEPGATGAAGELGSNAVGDEVASASAEPDVAPATVRAAEHVSQPNAEIDASAAGDADANQVEPAVPSSTDGLVAEPPTQSVSAAAEPVAATAGSKPPPEEPLRMDPDVAYVIVNEAGASVYSASRLGREEFPHHDATVRGAVSIGRRLQDPLSELVKIDPASIGVGMYQHDIKAKHLRESLDDVVSSCVNYVGVDLNTASPALLKYVSGLNQLTAQRLFDHRAANGPFKSREDLKSVQGFGDATFVQAAGFLKIVGGGNPLDATWIHPESYPVAVQILERAGATVDDLGNKERSAQLATRLAQIPLEQLATQLGIGTLTLSDIVAQLTRPGRDPRESLHPPIFKHGILKIDDLTPGMELQGTVLNVVDFGAFVDIGLKDSGLIHISQLANRYIQDPHEVVAVGDIVRVWVLGVDKDRRRVSLTMIAPGTPRQHEQHRGERGGEGKAGGRPPKPARPAARAGTSAASGGAPGGPPRTHEQRRGGGRPGRQGGKKGKPPATQPPIVQPKPKPRPFVPLSKDMIEGKKPLRTFGDLKQFWNIKQQESEEQEKSSDD